MSKHIFTRRKGASPWRFGLETVTALAMTAWLGACSDSSDGARTIQQSLTVTLSGDGTGTVSSTPAGIACGPTCTAKFESAATVTLSATPGAGSQFLGWSGACTGTGTCAVPMSAAATVTATFDDPVEARGRVDMAAGGSVEVSNPSSPIRGAKVTIEPGALGDGLEDISISFEDALPGPWPASAASHGAAQASKVLVLSRSGDVDLGFPALVTLPYDKTVVGDSGVPLVLYWDPTSSRYSAVAIVALDRSAGTVTFRTAHFSRFVVAVLKSVADMLGVAQPSVNTGFRPAEDGFFVRNFGAFDAPGGSCLGMANYAGWYYSRKKKTDGDSLFDSYREGVVEREEDDENVRELISRAYMFSSQFWAKRAMHEQAVEGERFTGIYLVHTMLFTGDPQTLLMSDSVPIRSFGHAATVYAYDADQGRFEVYDNNVPGEPVFLSWNPVTGFGDYTKYNGLAKEFAFDAMHSTFSPATFELLYEGVEGGWPASKFARLTLTAPAPDPAKKGRYLAEGADNVVLTGSVPRIAGENAGVQRYAHLYLGTADSAGVAAVDASGNFSFTIPKLPAATGTETFVLVSESDKTWRRGLRSLFHAELKARDSLFFSNFGFEKGDFSDWTSERDVWGGGDKVVPSDKSSIVSPGADPIATDLQVVQFGRHAARVNNDDPDYHISTVQQMARVPDASNPVIRFSWSAVLQDPQHVPEEQPYVQVRVVNLTRGQVLYDRRYYSNDPTYSGWKTYADGEWAAIAWQPVEIAVREFIGDDIQVTVTAADCALGGHGGYAYLDADE